MMNILVIPTTDWIYHPVPNRLNFIFDLLAEQHNIFVLHFNLKKFQKKLPRTTKCKLIKSGLISVNDPSIFYLLNAPFHFQTICSTIRERKIDLILSANILPSFLTNSTGVPVVFDYLDHIEESASIYYPASPVSSIVRWGVRLLTRFNLRHAVSVITLTNELKEFLQGVGVQRVSVIPNGVNSDLLIPLDKTEVKRSLGLEGKIIIGYVGSLEYWVDLETAVKALSDLPDILLLVVGPGLFTDYGVYIERLSKECGVRKRVIFTGAVPYEQINRYISAMDICLNPLKPMDKNRYVIGGKVFNYLACGRPVLSSRMVSLENLLGDTLYYYDDLPSFVQQVNTILASPQNEQKHREVALKYDWKNLARDYERVLQNAIEIATNR